MIMPPIALRPPAPPAPPSAPPAPIPFRYAIHAWADAPAAVRLLMSVLAVAWWLNLGDAGAFVQAAIGVVMIVATGYVAVMGVLDKRRREKDKADLGAEVERIKALDEARRETLSGQLAEIKRKADSADAESKANQLKMRQTLHDIRGQLHSRELENHELRDDLRAAHRDSVDLSRQLGEANKQISRLTQQLDEANGRIAKLTAEVMRLNHDEGRRAAKVEGMVAEMRETIEAGRTPSPTPDPDAPTDEDQTS